MDASLKKVIWTSLLGVLVLSCIFVWFQPQRGADVQQALADTRLQLRREGFKTELAEFNFTTDAAARVRESALTAFNTPRQLSRSGGQMDLMPVVADDAVIAIWKQNELEADGERASWQELHDQLDGNRWVLDDACAAAMSGPIAFDLDAAKGSAMLLRHLATLRNLAVALRSREILELHEGNLDAAWTNLFATTRLVTAWNPEPTEISHLVRVGLTGIAFNATWQALQTNGWSEARLAGLQREWETVDLFTNLPETAAFRRASIVAMCQRERQEPLSGGFSFSDFIKEAASSPMLAYADVKSRINEARYRSYGTFVDEKDLLLFFQGRERELRQAILSPSWKEMRKLPGVTNHLFFQSKYRSRLQSLINMQEMGMATQMRSTGLLGRAAEAETRRRILITAIALERYHKAYGAYPSALSALVPEFLPAVPVDFMDGRPLRYQPADDGHFTLYSVGLDCVDDGGKMENRAERIRNHREGLPGGQRHEADIVWPRPATPADIEAFRRQEFRAGELQQQAQLEDMSEMEWNRSPPRQARTEKILAGKWSPGATLFHEMPVVDIVSRDHAVRTNRLTLGELLTPKQIITGGEPEDITFQVAVSYDVIINRGSLRLLLDAEQSTDAMIVPDSGAAVQEFRRATNGDCQLVWHTIYDPPGRHAVQVALTLTSEGDADFYGQGPPVAITTSNLCQFSLDSATYNVERGATFHARLPEPNGRYTIECLTTNGEPLATLTGSTTNGEFDTVWNLVDGHGHRLTGETFNSTVQITLPDSGCTQTLRGP